MDGDKECTDQKPQQKLQALGAMATSDIDVYSYSPEFRFTNNCPKLHGGQRRFFDEYGFVIIPKLVPLDLIAKYKKRYEELCHATSVRAAPGMCMHVKKDGPNKGCINKIEDFIFDEVLSEYARLPQILDYVECFTGPSMKAIHTEMIGEPPDSSLVTPEYPLNQELHFFPFRPAKKLVCAWTAITTPSRANGCITTIPWSHGEPLMNGGYPNWKSRASDLQQFEVKMRKYIEMQVGDTVFYQPGLISGYGPNKTNECRMGISCHYASTDCYYVDVKEQRVTDELVQYARKKGCFSNDIKDLWQFKTCMMRGVESNL